MAEKPKKLSVKSEAKQAETKQSETNQSQVKQPEAKAPAAKSSAPVPAAGGYDWPSFADLRREIDSVFEDFTRDFFRFPTRLGASARDRLARLEKGFALQPAVDIVEADGGYRVTAELPGMDESTVDIRLVGDVLTIKGEKSESREEDERGMHVSERRFGSFERSFTLPPGIDRDKIDAKMTKGLLTITLPKSAAARSEEKKIGVKAG